MEDRFKERLSAALMGDLLVALAKREKLKDLLGEMEGEDPDRLIDELLTELEQIVEKRIRERREGSEAPAPEPDAPNGGGTPPAEQDEPKPFSFSRLFGSGPDADAFGIAGELAAAAREILGHSFPASSEQPPPESIPEEPVASEPPAPAPEPPPEEPEQVVSQESEPVLPPVEEPAPPVEVPHRPKHPRILYEFTDDDFVYVHGVSLVPDEESPSARPFMLEEKGIEDKDFAFAIDHRGLRLYLSKIHTRSSNVSKSGILLLNKQESITFRGRHESMLNELRCHGVLLPFEFGTVVHGRDNLLTKVDDHLTDLHLAVEDMSGTKWWEVSVYALDPRFAQSVVTEAPARTHRDRGRSGVAMGSASRLDIKTLDRMLGKQKKIAETVHEELSAVADRSDLDMKISLGGGTSEDWKLILKASYEVPPARFPSFIRTVTDIQYRHVMSDIMVAVAGEREPFSFQA